MLKLLKEVFRTGEATVKYPFAPVEVSKDFRGKPEHNSVACIACAACTIACPPNAIAMETEVAAGTRTWSIFYGRCIFCGRCEEVCPTGAISLTPQFELAVGRRDDLIKRAVFRLARCRSCGEPYSSAKEVAYVARILGTYANTAEEAERMRLHVELCPECKRKFDAEQITRTGIKRQMESRS
jgi:hydrogenase-4 component H